MVRALLGQGQADQPPAKARHEVNRLGRDGLRGHGQVAFVFPILIVNQDDHAPSADLGQCLLDAGNAQFAFAAIRQSRAPSVFQV